jgi:hypothetical protein
LGIRNASFEMTSEYQITANNVLGIRNASFEMTSEYQHLQNSKGEGGNCHKQQ